MEKIWSGRNWEKRGRLLIVFLLVGSLSPILAGEAPPQRPDTRVERLEAIYRLENDGTGVATFFQKQRILTSAGLASSSSVIVPFNGDREEVKIEFLRTLKADGRVVEADPAAAYETAPGEPQQIQVVTPLRFKHLAARELEVGDAVETRISSRLRKPIIPGGFFAFHNRLRAVPVDLETVVLDLPADREVVLWADPMVAPEVRDGRAIYRWSFSNPTPLDLGEKNPPVLGVSTFKSWEQVGAWIRTQFDQASPVTPAIEAKVRELTASKETPRAKAEALFRYVSSSVRYLGLAIGGFEFRPHAAQEVLQNGYGDCKDKQALLAAFFKAAGIPSAPALINAGADLMLPEVPAPLQFNHAITLVRLGPEEIWLEPSIGVARFGQVPLEFRGKDALVAELTGSRLQKVPLDTTSPQSIRFEGVGRIDPAGNFDFDGSVALEGDMEIFFRGLFQQASESKAREIVPFSLGVGDVWPHFEKAEGSEPIDVDGPFRVRFQVQAEQFINPLLASVDLAVPDLTGHFSKAGLAEAPTGPNEKKGASPSGASSGPTVKRLAGPAPMEVKEQLTIQLPDGYRADLPVPVRAETKISSYESQYTSEGSKLLIRRKWVLGSLEVPAGEENQIARMLKLIEKDSDQVIVLERTGAQTGLPAAELSIEQLERLAQGAIQAERFAEALPALLRIQAKEPQRKGLDNKLGATYFGLSRLTDAEKAYRKQADLDPLDPFAFEGLCGVYSRLNRVAEATDACNKQIEINPFSGYAYRMLAIVLVNSQNGAEAEKVVRAGLKANRDDKDLARMLVFLLRQTGRNDEARKMITDFIARGLLSADEPFLTSGALKPDIESNKNDAGAMALAEAETQFNDLKAEWESIRVPDDIIHSTQVVTRLIEALDRLGQIHRKNGQRDQARVYFRAAFDLSLNPVIAGRLAEVESEAGRFEEALLCYAFATRGGKTKQPLPKGLAGYLEKKYPKKTDRDEALATSALNLAMVRQLPTGRFTWPPGMALGAQARAFFRIEVDPAGKPVRAEALDAPSGLAKVAQADVLRLRFPPVKLPQGNLRTVRLIQLNYAGGQHVEAVWGYGRDPIGEMVEGLTASK